MKDQEQHSWQREQRVCRLCGEKELAVFKEWKGTGMAEQRVLGLECWGVGEGRRVRASEPRVGQQARS